LLSADVGVLDWYMAIWWTYWCRLIL